MWTRESFASRRGLTRLAIISNSIVTIFLKTNLWFRQFSNNLSLCGSSISNNFITQGGGGRQGLPRSVWKFTKAAFLWLWKIKLHHMFRIPFQRNLDFHWSPTELLCSLRSADITWNFSIKCIYGIILRKSYLFVLFSGQGNRLFPWILTMTLR